MWFELKPREALPPGRRWHGKVRFIIQFIYSKVTMLNGYVRQWDAQINMEEQELDDLNKAIA